jgi:hypothetical protein
VDSGGSCLFKYTCHLQRCGSSKSVVHLLPFWPLSFTHLPKMKAVAVLVSLAVAAIASPFPQNDVNDPDKGKSRQDVGRMSSLHTLS